MAVQHSNQSILDAAQAMADGGVFYPPDVGLKLDRNQTSTDTIKRRLKQAGYAVPSGLQDGFWVLTRKGGNVNYAGSE